MSYESVVLVIMKVNSYTIYCLRRFILSSLDISVLIRIDFKCVIRFELSRVLVRKDLKVMEMQCRKQSPSPGIGNCWYSNAFKTLVNLSSHSSLSGLEFYTHVMKIIEGSIQHTESDLL